MKVLLLACLSKSKSGNNFGGAEKSIINLANWLARKNYEVTLASVEGSEQSFEIDERVAFKGYEVQKKDKLSIHFQMFLNTRHAVKEFSPDIVIGFWIHPMFYLSLLNLKKKPITIYSERNDPNLEYGLVSKILRKHVMNYVDGIVFQTDDARNFFDKMIQEKSRVIHNPIYIKKKDYSLEIKDNRIVTVGRLSVQKNHKLLIESFEQIKDSFP